MTDLKDAISIIFKKISIIIKDRISVIKDIISIINRISTIKNRKSTIKSRINNKSRIFITILDSPFNHYLVCTDRSYSCIYRKQFECNSSGLNGHNQQFFRA